MNLYPYQKAGVEFLTNRSRALLADRMGLGKTVQAIRAAAEIKALNTLVVAPASLLGNWEAEWEQWGGPAKVRFVSYSKLARENTAGYGPDLMILDEAHYCKNVEAIRTRKALGVASRANYAWLLTGTPMPNDPTEVYPFFRYLWPERLEPFGIKTAEEWREHFTHCRYTDYGWKPYAVKNGASLRELLKGIMMRRQLSDVNLDLPPLRIDVHRLPKQDIPELEEYDAIEESGYMSTLRRVLGGAKAGPLADLLVAELRAGEYEKVVVLYHHLDTGCLLADAFENADISWCGFDGSTVGEARTRAVKAFQRPDGPSVFLAQQTAAGVGLTLHAAREIVLAEPDWSPTANLQAITRIHRIGQDHPCRARLFAVKGTLDEAVIGTIQSKLRMLDTLGLENGDIL